MGFLTYANGYVYATAYQGNRIYRIKSDGTEQVVFAGTGNAGTTDGDLLSASFNAPNGIAASATGDTLFVSDFDSRSLRMITGVNATITAIDDVAQPVNTFRLSQNYPNPFNPSTKIEFAIPKNGLVTLKVYDMLGRQVATLVNQNLNTGTYNYEFNGSNLSSGVYLYRLDVQGQFSETRKML
ncbi:MAG: T9SS type A sorting domain-containing protein, partial [Calditrichaeota bacterium]|nr:T9SS type A sorting domain-containing protein [Calditrichota bacterium]